METVEVIEEKKMIKRLLVKFLGNIFIYGLLYMACMVIFLMFAIFQDETRTSILMMCLVNVAINLSFMTMLSSSSINSAFNGINTVNVPAKSRGRLLKIVATILTIVMIIITIVNIINFHALFKSQIEINTYTINSSKPIKEIKYEQIKEQKTFVSVNEIEENKYLVTTKTYSQDAIIIITIIILLNILIVLGSINYENNLLKKYLTT